MITVSSDIKKCHCGRLVRYVRVDKCNKCFGIEEISAKEQGLVYSRLYQQATSKMMPLLEGRLHPTDILGALIVASHFTARKDNGLVRLDGKSWPLLSVLCASDVVADTKVDYSGKIVKSSQHAREFSELLILKFELLSGDATLVRPTSQRAKELVRETYGPEFPLRLRSRSWINHTRLAFGQISGETSGESQIQNWFKEDKPEGSYRGLLRTNGLPSTPLFSLSQRQMYKAWCLPVIQQLDAMKQDEIESILTILRGLPGISQRRIIGKGDDESEGFAFDEVRADKAIFLAYQTKHPDVFPRLIAGTGKQCLLPVLVPNIGTYGFVEELLEEFYFLVSAFGTGPSGTPLSSEAGRHFERLVARLLQNQGVCTTAYGISLIRVERLKNVDEIDVIAFSDDSVFLLECKAEIDPPGAWSDSLIIRRQQKLEKWLRDMEGKRLRWNVHLKEGKPVRVGSKTLQLPESDLPRTVRSGLISIRVEPALTGSFNIITLQPKEVAIFLNQKLPHSGFSPIVPHDQLSTKLEEWS